MLEDRIVDRNVLFEMSFIGSSSPSFFGILSDICYNAGVFENNVLMADVKIGRNEILPFLLSSSILRIPC